MQRLGGQIVFSMHYKPRTLALRDVRSEEPLVSLSYIPTHSSGIAYTSLVQGTTYSAHFSKNFVSRPNNKSFLHTLRSQIQQGLPYDYIVNHEDISTPFHAAPTQIREVLRRVTWAVQHIVGEQDTNPFNEVLAVGYFEGGKMGVCTSHRIKLPPPSSKADMVQFHDDGETVLGPTVMSLSLGCPALMSWRMKYQYFSGFVNKNRDRYHPTIPILPGCFRPEKRRELNGMASTMTPTELTQKAKELLKECPLSPPVVLKMKLRHGDIMGMHGVDLQKYHEISCHPRRKSRLLRSYHNTCLA